MDPVELAANVNANPYPLRKRHDPGFPVGKVLAAKVFTNPDGQVFVAAVLGYYHGRRLSFHDLGVNETPVAQSPESLPELSANAKIDFITDPNEIDDAWLDEATHDALIPIVQHESSYNAADTVQELIRIGLPYVLLVWNPYVTAIASEAGKATYTAAHRWLRKCFTKIGDLRSPVVDLHSYCHGCRVSFIFRGSDVKRNYAAHDALPAAAAQAERMVATMKGNGFDVAVVTYEFRDGQWFPSYAELSDGRLMTDNNVLIAVEQLPSG